MHPPVWPWQFLAISPGHTAAFQCLIDLGTSGTDLLQYKHARLGRVCITRLARMLATCWQNVSNHGLGEASVCICLHACMYAYNYLSISVSLSDYVPAYITYLSTYLLTYLPTYLCLCLWQ